VVDLKGKGMMAKVTTPLAQYASDTYSQFGEDGIIAECLSRISAVAPLNKWCVEFGAWDGVHLSNTCRLIREEGYSAVLVEEILSVFASWRRISLSRVSTR
jgi:hypothetical protein